MWVRVQLQSLNISSLCAFPVQPWKLNFFTISWMVFSWYKTFFHKNYTEVPQEKRSLSFPRLSLFFWPFLIPFQKNCNEPWTHQQKCRLILWWPLDLEQRACVSVQADYIAVVIFTSNFIKDKIKSFLPCFFFSKSISRCKLAVLIFSFFEQRHQRDPFEPYFSS